MNQSERRKYLIKELLGEQPRYKDIEISENNIEQKKLLRSLMNVRMAAPISAEFEKIQDDYLQEVNVDKGFRLIYIYGKVILQGLRLGQL